MRTSSQTKQFYIFRDLVELEAVRGINIVDVFFKQALEKHLKLPFKI